MIFQTKHVRATVYLSCYLHKCMLQMLERLCKAPMRHRYGESQYRWSNSRPHKLQFLLDLIPKQTFMRVTFSFKKSRQQSLLTTCTLIYFRCFRFLFSPHQGLSCIWGQNSSFPSPSTKSSYPLLFHGRTSHVMFCPLTVNGEQK